MENNTGNSNMETPNSTLSTVEPAKYTYLDEKLAWDIGTGLSVVEFIFAFILNGIIVVLILRKNRRNRMSFFVMHLAISDFLMSIFFIFPVVIDRLVDAWLAGEFLCRASSYLSLAVCYGSTYMLVVLSADRLYAVVRPLSATRRGVWYKWTLIATAWIIACLLAIPAGVFSGIVRIKKKPGTEFCEIRYPPEIGREIVLMIGILNMFLPAILISICYMWIVIVIWRRSRKGFVISSNSGNKNGDMRPESNLITKAKIRSIKITFVVVTVFILCWSPFTFTLILRIYRVIPPGAYFYILMALAPMNSVANPIVFLIFNYKILIKRQTQHGSAQNGTSMKVNYTTIRNDAETTCVSFKLEPIKQ